MAYIKKIVAKDEELIGIARIHWIYALRGLFWFALLAGSGWFINSLMTRILLGTGSAIDSYYIANMLITLGNGAMLFLTAGGFLVFFLFSVKLVSTEVGLTDRRVIHKEGLIFVKVHQIDHEEIRGEKLDLGWFGRILDYGYLMLDCRFIGDVRLPAIENPERFLRALHTMRGQTQDALSVMRGKSGAAAPLIVSQEEEQQPETPQPSQPTPEIQPGQPGPEPEVNPGNTPQTPEAPPMPTPHNPPAPHNPPPQPEAPPAQPAQPIPAPPPTAPPLQPPSETAPVMQEQKTQSPPPDVDPRVVAQIMQQVMPQMADQVVRKLADEGLLNKQPENDNTSGIPVDRELIASFDEARGKKGGHKNDMHDQMEHVIH